MIMNPYNKKNEGAIAGPGQLSYSFEHLHMEKPRAWKTMDGVRLSSMLFTRLKDISTMVGKFFIHLYTWSDLMICFDSELFPQNFV